MMKMCISKENDLSSISGKLFWSACLSSLFPISFVQLQKFLRKEKDGSFFVSQQSVIPVAIKPSEALSGNGIAVVLINEEKLNSFFERLSIDRSSFIYLQNTQTEEILNSPSDAKYEICCNFLIKIIRQKIKYLSFKKKEKVIKFHGKIQQ